MQVDLYNGCKTVVVVALTCGCCYLKTKKVLLFESHYQNAVCNGLYQKMARNIFTCNFICGCKIYAEILLRQSKAIFCPTKVNRQMWKLPLSLKCCVVFLPKDTNNIVHSSVDILLQ